MKGKNGKFIKQTFHNIEDVWDVIWLLKKETIENSKGAESISIAGSVSTQLPFFCCPNNIIDVSHSSIISKYFYCKEFTVSPFKGSYGDTPSRWIQQVSIIKNAVGIIERRAANKSKNKG